MKTPKTVIGWTEYIDFPEWDIAAVRAKVDTGARTSALHVENLVELRRGRVRFDVVTGRKNRWRRQTVECAVLKWARVRSSTGVYKKRCFVTARIRVGEFEKEIEVSLVSREKMLFRMLLGRKALEHDFVVDVSHRAVVSKKPKRKTAPAGTARPSSKAAGPKRGAAAKKKKPARARS